MKAKDFKRIEQAVMTIRDSLQLMMIILSQYELRVPDGECPECTLGDFCESCSQGDKHATKNLQ